LLRLLAGDLAPDEGMIWRETGLKVAALEQSLPLSSTLTVFDAVSRPFQNVGDLLAEYHRVVVVMETGSIEQSSLDDLENLQQRIDHADGWTLSHKIESVLDQFELDGNATLNTLSGGWLRRVAIARSMVTEPDVWLLDEPTNHLDIPTIEWFQRVLLEFDGTLVFITHDRQLMQNVATSIVDLDRGRLSRWDCDYHTFLARRAHQLEVEEAHNREFDRRLQKEEAWIRQGIKARRTRNEGRVRSLEKMREARKQRRVSGKLKLDVDAGHRSGQIVNELENVSKSYDDKVLIRDLNLIIQRGDRIGILGPNGCGKSTLLKILLGRETPDQGRVKIGTNLEIAYFDQVRDQIDPDQTVAETIGDGRDYVSINGNNTHVVTWLSNFLFTPAQARSPVRVLSGGEQNRLMLAKLFSLPANLLVMDEPTNDLDVESLELLEELLVEYQGTVLLVTHDRAFLDNVASSLLVFEGNGILKEHVGGYSDWVAAGGSFDHWFQGKRGQSDTIPTSEQEVPASSHTERKADKRARQKRERELASLPDKLDKLEERIALLHEKIADPRFFQQPGDQQQKVRDQLADAESERETLFTRWEELEG
ncbi:MAG: ATP-binding cassette domain-containing protein, partial [Pseudomonadales bacterium]